MCLKTWSSAGDSFGELQGVWPFDIVIHFNKLPSSFQNQAIELQTKKSLLQCFNEVYDGGGMGWKLGGGDMQEAGGLFLCRPGYLAPPASA